MKIYITTLLFVLFLAKSIEGQVVRQPTGDRWGKYGTVERQNRLARSDDLSRIQTLRKIKSFAKGGYLSPLSTGNFEVDTLIPKSRRYARPWTIAFLNELNDSLRINFGKNLIVTSCVRDVAKQKQLRRRLGKAAAPEKGANASTHLTGAACDLSDRNLEVNEIKYLREVLKPYAIKCLIDEKPHGPDFHFHVFVSRRYETGETCPVPIPLFKMPKINLSRFEAAPYKYALKH